ncbi:hypothetical protein RFI_07681 [Reticulomyxa filosa]|uniref:Galectin n=1 Tax=Reticulomyxa filosa TaxID=46433 RepID=X6NVZ7_RETFI|nr:hypothetical protein RFI_07681 [Reticulomyxa filosa]|eukprot:ETO29437.1 hypothetical protein RFI_07681 [Reticulomyxa filosa]
MNQTTVYRSSKERYAFVLNNWFRIYSSKTVDDLLELVLSFATYSLMNTSFAWPGGKCKRRQYLGRVTITGSVRVSFEFTVHGIHGNGWGSMLHVGSSASERVPGIWFYPNSLRLYIRFSDCDGTDQSYDIKEGFTCSIGETYKLFLQSQNNGGVVVTLNGNIIAKKDDAILQTKYQVPVFAGNTWDLPAAVTIKNLIIQNF